MKFTLPRNLTVSSVSGHSIAFKKNEPTYVPKSMHHEVLAIGAQPADAKVEDIEFDDQAKGPEKVAPVDPAERNELIKMALADIKTRNVRDEFTATGKPKAKVVATALGFEVAAREIDELWLALLGDEAKGE